MINIDGKILESMTQRIILKAFTSLDVSSLEFLSESLDYSHDYKEELIDSLKKVFKSLKSRGIISMTYKPTICPKCYPGDKAYDFYDSETGDFVVKYIMSLESEKFYRIQECRNNPLPKTEDGLPF